MKDRTRKIIVAVLLVIAVCCAGYLIWYYATAAKTKQSYDDAKKLATENVKPSKTDSDDGEQTKPEIPVDFTALQEKNPDIYAWIKMMEQPLIIRFARIMRMIIIIYLIPGNG